MVKHMNQMVLYSKCMAIRDTQVGVADSCTRMHPTGPKSSATHPALPFTTGARCWCCTMPQVLEKKKNQSEEEERDRR
jgi:hypothetical protein